MPRFDVWIEENADRVDAHSLEALSHRDAAERWADGHDHENDYALADENNDFVVCVAEQDEETVRRYRVTGRQTIDYTATPIDGEKPNA